jgi:hypothetical protein
VRRTIGCAWVVLLLALPACSSGTKADAGPTASVTAPSTTADPQAAVKAEVEAAYLKSWEISVEAYRTLEIERLVGRYAGAALETRKAEFERLRSAGHVVRLRVEHGDLSTGVTGETASVEETYRNHSVLIDRSTGAPLEPEPDEDVTVRYSFEKQEGRWVIVRTSRL